MSAAVVAIVKYTALYFPATFLLEEVAFPGALNAHVHHNGEGGGWVSAVVVSALWGIWHLPVSHALPFAQQLVELVVVHVLLGGPLSFTFLAFDWRPPAPCSAGGASLQRRGSSRLRRAGVRRRTPTR